MKVDFEALLPKIDEAIRGGRGPAAREELEKLHEVKIPRPFAAGLALLAWRADMPGLGIRWLNPIVRPDRKAPVEATEEEKAEYAQCLIRIGAAEEARVLLQSIEQSRLPQVLLYRASVHLSRWEYEETVPLLERYVKCTDISPYQRLVGRVNLAASLVCLQQNEKATAELKELLEETSLKRHTLLYGNLLEIAAQHYVFQSQWNDVNACLEEARTALKEAPGGWAFYVQKWKAIATVLKSKGKKGSLDELSLIRDAAKERGYWESVRQCDEMHAKASEDEGLFTHLYFGTPFQSFRDRILAQFKSRESLPREYLWCPGGRAVATPLVDLLSGEATQGKKIEKLKPGQLLHRLLVTLSADFYRPIRLASVHFQLYPGEYFNPVTSPFRVYEAVKRLRQWLDESDFPLAIDEHLGAYHLSAKRDCALKLYQETEVSHKHTAALLKLKTSCGEVPFSVGDACKVLALPARSAQRLLESAMAEGHIVRTGQSRATRYHFKG